MKVSEKGLQRFKEVMGEEALAGLEKLEAISPDFSRLAIDFVYGELFTREGISDKMREVAIVGCLVGQGNTGVPLRNHLRGMLNVGWTKNEIVEILILLSGYKGFPSSLEALEVLSSIIDERKAS